MESCEKHGMGTENGKEYTIIGMARWFHKLPHIRFWLKPIEYSMFDPYNGQYITSLIMFALLCLFVCITILAIFVVFSIVVFYQKTKNSNVDTEKSHKKVTKDDNQNESSAQNKGIGIGWKVVLFLLAIVCGLSFFCGFFGVWNIYVGLGTVHNSSRDAVIWFRSIREDFGNADLFKTLNLKERIDNLKDNINSVGIFPQKLVDKFIHVLDKTVDFAHKANEEVIKTNVPLLINLSRIDIEWIPRDIESYGNIVCGSLLAGVLILAIVGLLFTCAIFNTNLLAISILISIFGILLNAVLMSASLTGTVAVSDFCLDAKPFIRDQLNEPILYKYLVECYIKSNKIINILNTAENLVLQMEKTFNVIIDAFKKIFEIYCKTSNRLTNLGLNVLSKIVPKKLIDIPKNMNITCPTSFYDKVNTTIYEIKHLIRTYTQLLSTLKEIADCRRANKDLYDVLNAVCEDINPGFLYIYVFSILTFICLIIIIFCATFALISSYKHKANTEPKSEPKNGPKNETKIQPKTDSKVESRIKPKVGPKVEPKVGSKVEPKVGSKVEPKVKPKIKDNKQIKRPTLRSQH